jgi:hypothetical protein
MPRWLFVTLLLLQAHFAASHLVPLDERSQREFGGLLRWAWPWSLGDRGPLGQVATVGLPVVGVFIAMGAGSALFLAALAVLRWRVPFDWWRPATIVGGVLSVVLMLLFFGPTKVLPLATALAVLAVALNYWRLATP